MIIWWNSQATQPSFVPQQAESGEIYCSSVNTERVRVGITLYSMFFFTKDTHKTKNDIIKLNKNRISIQNTDVNFSISDGPQNNTGPSQLDIILTPSWIWTTAMIGWCIHCDIQRPVHTLGWHRCCDVCSQLVELVQRNIELNWNTHFKVAQLHIFV